jgi:NAD(P)-dependent dehydrogenase (short-subunit alcohol dehydrogenase family)
MAHQDRLANTHILIFGGTSGIGFAVANMALSHGAQVTISGSATPKVEDRAAKLRSFYPDMPAVNVAGYACDLSDKANLESSLKELLDRVTSNGSNKIDHIVYTAGAPDYPKLRDVTVDNALGPMLTRMVAPGLIAKLIATGTYMSLSDASSLTVTGGTNTDKPMRDWTFAAAAGGSLTGLVRGLAVDLSPLRINCVVPGAIHTELLQGLVERIGEEATGKMKKQFSLGGTFGKPEDTAEAYGYLMRDRFATGSFVRSDGGRLLVPGE